MEQKIVSINHNLAKKKSSKKPERVIVVSSTILNLWGTGVGDEK